MSPARGTAAARDPRYARGIVLVMLAGGFWSLGGILVRLVEQAGGWQILTVRSIALSLTLLALTEMVLAPVWPWLALGEVPTVLTLVGGAIVFAAIVGQALSQPRRKPPPIGAV